MAKISIADIARRIVKKHHLSQAEAERVINGMIDVINDGLRYEKQVKIKGLGTFKVIETKDRESVNVNTGERIVIEGRGKITFTPDAVMRDIVNRPFSQFETVVINDGVSFDDLETAATSEQTPEVEATELPVTEQETPEVEPESTLVEEETPDVELEVPAEPEIAAVEPEIAAVEPEIPTVEQTVDEAEPEAPAIVEGNVPQVDVAIEEPVIAAVASIPAEEETNKKEVEEEKPTSDSEPSEHGEHREHSEHSEESDTHHSHGSHHSHSSREHHHSHDSSHSYRRHMHYQHLMEKQEKRFRSRMTWTVVLGSLAALVIAAGAYLAGKQMGIREMTAKMEEPLVDNYLSEDSVARIMEAEARADSASKAALLAKQKSDYALKKRAKEFTRHAENIDVASRQQAEEMTEAKLRKQAADMRRLEDEKRAQNEARARADAAAKQAAAKKASQAQQVAKAQQPAKPQQQASKAASGAFPSAKYDQMNAQVRLGAYRIVGVDQTVTVRKGQTLAGISKAFLGPGMECYVEALNDGIKSVSEGQKLKIPKLELRKKAAKK